MKTRQTFAIVPRWSLISVYSASPVVKEVVMNEQDFFNEKQELKKATYSCPHCRERIEYEVRWLKRTKKPGPPRGANEQDRMRFQKSRDYMVRVDDMLMCKNVRCRRRFEIPSSQSVVFI